MIKLLSKPLKMPCYGFNLPAMKFCPAGKKSLELEDPVCNECYALGGTYIFPTVKKALKAKGDFLLKSLREDKGDSFVAEMVKQITDAYSPTKKKLNGKEFNKKLFRVHDSGDLFSPAYIDCWIRICKQLPKITFWFPTREYIRNSQLPKLKELASLSNTVVKPSALSIGQEIGNIEGLDKGTTVCHTEAEAKEKDFFVCPATKLKAKIGLGEWRKLSKEEQWKNSTCAGAGCDACFKKGFGKTVAYLAH